MGQAGQRTGELHRTGSSRPQRGCRDPFLSVFSCVDQAWVTFLFKCRASHSSVCSGVELGGGRGGIAYLKCRVSGPASSASNLDSLWVGPSHLHFNHHPVCFLGLLRQMTTSWVAQNNRNSFSVSSGD